MSKKSQITIVLLIILLVTGFSLIALSVNVNNAKAEDTKLTDPLHLGNGDPQYKLMGRIIKALLGMVGVVALIFFIIGGFMLLTSGGNPEKIKKGRDTLVWAIIGIAVCLGSYAILNAVLLALTSAT